MVSRVTREKVSLSEPNLDDNLQRPHGGRGTGQAGEGERKSLPWETMCADRGMGREAKANTKRRKGGLKRHILIII